MTKPHFFLGIYFGGRIHVRFAKSLVVHSVSPSQPEKTTCGKSTVKADGTLSNRVNCKTCLRAGG